MEMETYVATMESSVGVSLPHDTAVHAWAYTQTTLYHTTEIFVHPCLVIFTIARAWNQPIYAPVHG